MQKGDRHFVGRIVGGGQEVEIIFCARLCTCTGEMLWPPRFTTALGDGGGLLPGVAATMVGLDGGIFFSIGPLRGRPSALGAAFVIKPSGDTVGGCFAGGCFVGIATTEGHARSSGEGSSVFIIPVR